MSLKRLFLSKIDRLFGSNTEHEREEAHASLRRLVEKVLPELRPIDLRWDVDAKDPDVSNAIDKINGIVWQIEDLETLIVVRVFDANREMVLKQRLAPTKDLPILIEAVRQMIYTTGTTLDRAFEHYVLDSQRETEAPAKAPVLDRLVLTPAQRVMTPENHGHEDQPEIMDLGR